MPTPPMPNGVPARRNAGSDSRLIDQLREIILAPTYSPPRLPEEAMELLRLSRKVDVTFDEILSVLERDALLAAQVLRTAQSAAYAAGTTIRSLKNALVRLGLRNLTDIFLATAVQQRIFRVRGYEEKMGVLRRHSLVTAHIARVVSKHTELFDDLGFLCGLLHDVGVAALVYAITDVHRGRLPPPISEVWQPIVAVHAEASAVICEAWGLGTEVVEAVRLHHSVTAGKTKEEIPPLAALVAFSDDLARRLDAGANESRASESVAAIRILGLAEHAVERIEVEAAGVVASIDGASVDPS